MDHRVREDGRHTTTQETTSLDERWTIGQQDSADHSSNSEAKKVDHGHTVVIGLATPKYYATQPSMSNWCGKRFNADRNGKYIFATMGRL